MCCLLFCVESLRTLCVLFCWNPSLWPLRNVVSALCCLLFCVESLRTLWALFCWSPCLWPPRNVGPTLCCLVFCVEIVCIFCVAFSSFICYLWCLRFFCLGFCWVLFFCWMYLYCLCSVLLDSLSVTCKNLWLVFRYLLFCVEGLRTFCVLFSSFLFFVMFCQMCVFPSVDCPSVSNLSVISVVFSIVDLLFLMCVKQCVMLCCLSFVCGVYGYFLAGVSGISLFLSFVWSSLCDVSEMLILFTSDSSFLSDGCPLCVLCSVICLLSSFEMWL